VASPGSVADLMARSRWQEPRRMPYSLSRGNRAIPQQKAFLTRRTVTRSMPHRRNNRTGAIQRPGVPALEVVDPLTEAAGSAI
jgi:hypothetical protein